MGPCRPPAEEKCRRERIHHPTGDFWGIYGKYGDLLETYGNYMVIYGCTTRPGKLTVCELEAMALFEIVDLSSYKMGGFSSSLCESLPGWVS